MNKIQAILYSEKQWSWWFSSEYLSFEMLQSISVNFLVKVGEAKRIAIDAV